MGNVTVKPWNGRFVAGEEIRRDNMPPLFRMIADGDTADEALKKAKKMGGKR